MDISEDQDSNWFKIYATANGAVLHKDDIVSYKYREGKKFLVEKIYIKSKNFVILHLKDLDSDYTTTQDQDYCSLIERPKPLPTEF